MTKMNPTKTDCEEFCKKYNSTPEIYADYLPVIGGDEFEFLMEGRIECKNFLKEYKINHAKCPKCGAESHSTTYVGYILHMDKKDEYKDLNKCVCSECGNVHTTHDRVR